MSEPAFRRVFVLVPDCYVSSGHYESLWRRHFIEGIRREVANVSTPEGVRFDWARDPGRSGDAISGLSARRRHETSLEIWRQLESIHAQAGVEAVISYCFANDVEIELVERVREAGIPWINFFCDSTHRFGEVEELARRVSLNWFPEAQARRAYEALGAPCLCAPYALNPDFLPELSCGRLHREVGFIGLPSANRITQLGWLRLLGCRVEVRGPGWVGAGADPFGAAVHSSTRVWRALRSRGLAEKILRRFFWIWVRRQAGPALSDEEFPLFVRETSLILGLNQGRDARGRLSSYLKFRDVEFPGYGCCYLTEWSIDLDAAFEVGKEVLACRSAVDATRQWRRLRAEPELRRSIGLAGRERVLRSHTWKTRLSQIRGALPRA